MKLNQADKEELDYLLFNEAFRDSLLRVMQSLAEADSRTVLTSNTEDERRLLIVKARYDGVMAYLKRFNDFIREHRKQAK